MCLISGNKSVQQSCERVACRFISCAFVLSPFSESPRHRNPNFSSSLFSEKGFLPAKAAPGISSSVRITASETRLVEAIFAVIDHPWPTKPRFHVFETRLSRAAAIYEYGVYSFSFHASSDREYFWSKFCSKLSDIVAGVKI